jgi:hypothetical protein
MVIYIMTKYDSQWNDSRENRNWKAWGLSICHQFWESGFSADANPSGILML